MKEKRNDRILCLTEDPAEAERLSRNGICCIGIDKDPKGHPEASSFFTGAYAVVSGEEAPDPAWLEMMRCHYYGEAYVLYESDKLRVRECTVDDYAEIERILTVSGMRQDVFLSAAPENEGNKERVQGKTGTDATTGAERERGGWRDCFEAYVGQAYAVWGFGMYAVEMAGKGIVGWCGLMPSESGEGGVELGYVIDPDRRRQGIALEACHAILVFAEEHLGIEEVLVRIQKKNKGSLAFAERLKGFSDIPDLRILSAE